MMKFDKQFAHLLPAESEMGVGLIEKEKSIIFMLADLRKRRLAFKEEISDLKKPEEDDSAIWENELQEIFHEASGEKKEELTEEAKEQKIEEIENIVRKAKAKERLFPNLSALLFSQAAKLQESMGVDFEENLKRAKESTERSADIPKKRPTDFLADAVIMGIAVRQTRKAEIPDKDKVASFAANDPHLLAKYALILKDEERKQFLELLPEDKRHSASLIMDASLDPVLREKFAATETEQRQRRGVQKRSGKEMEEKIESSDTSSNAAVKILSQTLREMEGDDSARLLLELGTKGLAKAKGEEKNTARISHTARVLRELAILDQNKGSALAMKFLGKKELPDRLFLYFARQMTNNGYITKNSEKYLEDKNNIPFLKKLISQHPNQLNTVLDTLSQIPDYSLAGNEKEIFSAISDLESITPIIFNRYRAADSAEKKELARKLRELKPKFFQNVPIGGILPKEDQEILAEMVYLAYKPIGMNFEDVKRFIEKIKDRTKDLDGYVFPAQGYDFSLSDKKAHILKKGETIDYGRLGSYREIFSAQYPQTESQVKEFAVLAERLAKAGTDLKDEELRRVLSVLGADQMVRNFTGKYQKINDSNAYDFLNELKEIIGVYFKDYFPARIGNFLEANPKIKSRIVKILSNAQRQTVFEKKLSKPDQKIDWENALVAGSDLAKNLSDFIYLRVLKSVREEIQKNANKFVEEESGAASSKKYGQLKAYISKNIGSFFAKASAGICTAEDVGLFKRSDHFHINVVENDDFVRANIQAYFIEDRGEKCLVLRGFNPNTDFLSKIDPGAFCEKVIEIAKKFAEDNGMKKVYITDDLGGWHALSNRDNVSKYLVNRYKKEKNRKKFHLQISNGQNVDSIYEV